MAERESIRLAIDVEASQTEAVKVDFIDFVDIAANFPPDFVEYAIAAKYGREISRRQALAVILQLQKHHRPKLH